MSSISRRVMMGSGGGANAMLVLVGPDAPYINVFDAYTYNPISGGPSLSAWATDAVFSRDNKLLAVLNSTKTALTVYDTATWLVAGSPTINGVVQGMDFSPDGAYLAVAAAHTIGGGYEAFSVFRTSDWSRVTMSDTLTTQSPSGVAFSPDGASLAVTTSVSPYIYVYKTSDWKHYAGSPSLASSPRGGLAWTLDGSVLAAAYSDRVRLYDTSDWSNWSPSQVSPSIRVGIIRMTPDFMLVAGPDTPYFRAYNLSDFSTVSGTPNLGANPTGFAVRNDYKVLATTRFASSQVAPYSIPGFAALAAKPNLTTRFSSIAYTW